MSVMSFILAFIVLSIILTLIKILPGFVKAFMYATGTFFIIGFSLVVIMYFVNLYILPV